MNPMRRVALVVNPRSGDNTGLAAADAAAAAFRACGLDAMTLPTERRGHASELARQAADAGCDTVFAVGGDGTVNEVVRGLTELPETVVGVIPIGTANVLARETGMPRGDPAAAARAAVHGEVREIDWGLADGRLFVVNCGVGFDARVVRRLSVLRRRRAGRLSKLSYALPGLAELWRWRPPSLRITVDGVTLSEAAGGVIVCNARNYGGVLVVTPDASIDDGRLDICIRSGGGRFSLIADFCRAILRLPARAHGSVVQGRRIEIVSAMREPLQIDGDPAGFTPVAITLAPRKLKFRVPVGENRP